MAFIEVIEYENSENELREAYDKIISKRGKLAEVHKIQSLNPATILTHVELYMSIMFGQSPLNRAQREMIAVVVSSANGCQYCQQHHGTALNNYWKNEHKVMQLRRDFEKIALSPQDMLLCKFANRLTLDPQFSRDEKIINELRKAGLSDREILDATLVIAYFNFVNRIVMGLGVEMESDKGEGYKY
jgi:uncharacterized peroxidase-related enzyme